MPLKAGKSRTVIASNVREMQAAGHSHAQSVAASLRNAGVKRKDPPMKAKSSMTGMDGGKGMSPRKAMASGLTSGGGNFGADLFHEMNGGSGVHPDHAAHTGMDGAMDDGERATPPGIHHTKGHLPAQAAPRHGPHHPGNHGADWMREGKA